MGEAKGNQEGKRKGGKGGRGDEEKEEAERGIDSIKFGIKPTPMPKALCVLSPVSK